jgi:Uncharacterized membrane protein
MDWYFVLRLTIAGILGAIIGLDREYRAKEAGFRTHFLVCLGSALFMIISQYGFLEFSKEHGTNFDASRVAAQIVSGIGFLGAGTIIFQKQFIRGLTTAAGLWATAGIGMAIGGGLYFLGVSATILTLVGLEALTFFFKQVSLSSAMISFITTNKEDLEKVLSQINKHSYYLVSYSSYEEKHGEITLYNVSFTVKIRGEKDHNKLFEFIQSLENVSQLKIE